MKFNETLRLCVEKVIKNNRIPMLVGEPGIGKSSWLENLAAGMHTKCFTLPCNQLAEKADLTGCRLVPYEREVKQSDGTIAVETDYKQVFYPHEVITEAINYAESHPRETPILFFDEINRTEAGVTSELLSIPTLRAIGKRKLPANLRVVIAGNDKGNVTALDSASISRFVIYHVEPDPSTFIAIHGQTLNPYIQAVLNKHPETIFCKTRIIETSGDGNDDDDDNVMIEDIIDESDEMLQLTTPRTIAALNAWLNEFDNATLMKFLGETHITNNEEISVLQENIEAHVGRTDFSTYLIAEITQSVMATSGVAGTNTVTVGKPNCYTAFKACTDMTAIENSVSAMTPEDLSGCLIYALYEKTDNAPYISAICQKITQILPDDMRTLMTLASSGQLDTENAQAFLESNAPVAQTLSAVLSSMI